MPILYILGDYFLFFNRQFIDIYPRAVYTDIEINYLREVFMEFFEKATRVIGKYADSAGKKAGEITARAKIRFALANLQGDLDELYEKLGAIRYDAVKSGFDNGSRERAAIAKIDRIKADMELLKAELEVSKLEGKCHMCGEKVAKGSEFCPYCGEDLKN